jgi:hypothetical protein
MGHVGTELVILILRPYNSVLENVIILMVLMSSSDKFSLIFMYKIPVFAQRLFKNTFYWNNQN